MDDNRREQFRRIRELIDEGKVFQPMGMEAAKEKLKQHLSGVMPANTSELKQTLVARACSYELANAIGDEIDRLRAELEAAKGNLLAPGVMRCAKCKFGLQRVTLNVCSGTATAGDSKTETCPNGCGPLWPVTWKELSTEHFEAAERFFNESVDVRKYNELLQSELTEARRVIDGARKQVRIGVVEPDRNGAPTITWRNGQTPKAGTELYAAPVPQPAVPEAVAKDAERYRWLRDRNNSLETRQYDKGVYNGPSCYHEVEGIRELKSESKLDDAIDAAILSATDAEVKNGP